MCCSTFDLPRHEAGTWARAERRNQAEGRGLAERASPCGWPSLAASRLLGSNPARSRIPSGRNARRIGYWQRAIRSEAGNITGAAPRYEQLRARAMIMLLRHTALRVSDVCTLRKDAVSRDPEQNTWRVLLYTQKTGDPVFLPIPETLKPALDALPMPRNAAQNCLCYFWNGQSSRRAVVGIAERTLFRSLQEIRREGRARSPVSAYAGDTAFGTGSHVRGGRRRPGEQSAVVRKHYGKWSKGRQSEHGPAHDGPF